MLIGVLAMNHAHAQVSSYVFSQSSGTYTAITGGTVLGNNSNDDEVFNNSTTGQLPPATGIGFPIGFNFVYDGVTYDKFAVSTNGWIVLGTGTFQIGDQAFFETPISIVGPAGFANLISGFGVDLGGQGGGSLRFQTIGTTPNQTLVVQWKKATVVGNTGYDLNFQIRLNQTSNSIDVIYGTMQNPFDSGESAEVGLRGATNADFNNRYEISGWATTTRGTTNDATCDIDYGLTPNSGLTFTWTPVLPCSGIPAAGSATSSASPVCNSVLFTLSLTGSSSNSGLTYQWQSSADTITWANISGASNPIFSITENATTYYRAIVSCGVSSDTSNNVEVVFTSNPMECYCYVDLGGGCSSIDHIDTVLIAGTTLFNPNTGCANLNGVAYSVYPISGIAADTLKKNVAYTLSVTSSANSNILTWIDYDQSGTFDVSEFILVNPSSIPNVASSVSITIPGTALTGQTRMRIRTELSGFGSGAADACSTFSSGETEDYLIIIASDPLGINSVSKLEESLTIFPNPANDHVYISFKSESEQVNSIKLINVTGQLIYEESLKQNSGRYNKTVDLTGLSKGIYLLQIISDKQVLTKRVVIE